MPKHSKTKGRGAKGGARLHAEMDKLEDGDRSADRRAEPARHPRQMSAQDFLQRRMADQEKKKGG